MSGEPTLFDLPEPEHQPYYHFEPEVGPDGRERFTVWKNGILQITTGDGRRIDAPPELRRPIPTRRTRAVKHVCAPPTATLVCACGRRTDETE